MKQRRGQLVSMSIVWCGDAVNVRPFVRSAPVRSVSRDSHSAQLAFGRQ